MDGPGYYHSKSNKSEKDISMGLLLRCCRGQGPHLAMTGEPRGVSGVVASFLLRNMLLLN